MKPRLSTLILALTLLVSACNRFSYREDYIGNFAFEERRTVRNASVPDTTNTTFDGTVSLYGTEQIVVRFQADDSLSAFLESDGRLRIDNLQPTSTFSGSYSDFDHLSFETTFTNFLGERIWSKVTGVR